MSEATTTIDHDEIRRWAEERGGRPAAVRGTGGKDDAGILRIDFPERGDPYALEEISWDEFFEAFEANELAFLHQDRTSDGKLSRFSKFVTRSG
ncbi:hypothetical protein [Alsobacter sp. R-9]